MLADNLESWAKRERQEGVNEGQKLGEVKGETRGMAISLRSLITLKFNGVPDWVEQRIDAASNDELRRWIENILKADDLEAVFKD